MKTCKARLVSFLTTVAVLVASIGVGILLVPSLGTPLAAAADSVGTPGGCTTSWLNIVAHNDDDLLFLNPSLATQISYAVSTDAACVRTIIVTTGDAGQDAANWGWGSYAWSREMGTLNAYAYMAGVVTSNQGSAITSYWTENPDTISGDPYSPDSSNTIVTYTLNAHPNVTVQFMQTPDGDIHGFGFASDNWSTSSLNCDSTPCSQGTSSYPFNSLY
ncbi:MAG: hypothetical protein ACRDVP_01565, partial [Acidimicrobiales bacterium]